MADPARARRLAVRIREVVASALERGVKDPRLGMVTVTDARVTPDLSEATVFYTVYGDDLAREESARALESAKGLLRSQVGRATGVKSTPTLTFVHDRLPEDARHLAELIDTARERDNQLALAREGAQPVGEADPYRRPREVSTDVLEAGLDAAGGTAGLDGIGDVGGVPGASGTPGTSGTSGASGAPAAPGAPTVL